MIGRNRKASETKKRVLIISALDCWSMGQNKGAPSLWETLKGYAERGWDVYFITGNNREENANTNIEPNIYVIRFDTPWLKRLMPIKKLGFFARIVWWLWFQTKVLFKALRLHSKHPIDLVYGYEIHGVPIAKLLSKLWGVPVVSRFQGTSLGLYWMKKKFWMLRAWDHVLGLKIPTDLVIMTNDGTQGNRVLEQLGVKTDRVRFWINGVDWELFEVMPDKDEARRNLGIDRKWVLLTVSRLIGWKRVERSIRALPEVVKEYSDVILIVVGDGPERAYLEKLTKELGMENHVRFEGAVGRKEIPKYFAAADIFLSLYDWSNVGNPLLEAMMAGKCIVTLNNGDTGKFIENGYNGVLLEYEELQKLPEVIKRLLADEGCRKQLGKNARRFAKEYFWTWQERMDAEVKEVSNLIKQWERRKIG